MLIDATCILISLNLTFYFLPSNTFGPNFVNSISIKIFIPIFGIFLYYFLGHYKSLTRYIRSKDLYFLIYKNLYLIILLFIFIKINNLVIPSFKSFLLLWILITFLVGGARFVIRDLLNLAIANVDKKLPKVYIYGAGSAGAQLVNALISSKSHKVLGFIDDNPNLWDRSINGIQIYPINILDNKLIKFDHVLLAIPSLSRTNRTKILNKLQTKGTSVLQIPSLDELSLGKNNIDNLSPIKLEDLLGRDPINIDLDSLQDIFLNKVICVTGAGGSIGSELCRQILYLRPSKLLLFDLSEHNLYKIHQELTTKSIGIKEIVPVLGDVTNLSFLEDIFSKHSVDYIFHSAAYKHVPLVEINPLQGIYNNVISTKNICTCAKRFNVKKVILISTDKAVRPTNIMGASKRLAEIVVQAFDQESKNNMDKNQSTNCLFSMVRFGNVLGSSGSVVPLFEDQIAKGGPITITHKNIIRYFMTISEAAHLVLQSSLFSKGGEVFLLDMGSPIKIIDLAEKMIRLSGFRVKNELNLDGEIEIITSGLRPGEKLYEELLIDAKAEKTHHPLIYKAREKRFDPEKLWVILEQLESKLKNMDLESSLEILIKLVPEWNSSFKK